MPRFRAAVLAAPAASLLAGLGGCHPPSAQDAAQQKVRGCAAMADPYLDPHWQPRVVSDAHPASGGVEAVIAAQGTRVTVTCGVISAYYSRVLGELETIQGVQPAPGQLYLPTQHRWLTEGELHARLTAMLAPRPGEYAGARWAPNPPGVYTVSDLAGVPSTACFTLQSRLAPARELVACQVGAGHRYWVEEGLKTVEVSPPPPALPAIPPAPPADLSTQPGGAAR